MESTFFTILVIILASSFSLQLVRSEWLTETSELFESNGNRLTYTGEEVGNALWVVYRRVYIIGASGGEHYWKFRIFDDDNDVAPTLSSLSVGITDQSKFSPGYNLRALLYTSGGNLANGASLLQSRFGPSLHRGDCIGVLVRFIDDNIKVYFDINGKSLGLAFDLLKGTFDPEGVFPVVQFNGPETIEINKVKLNEGYGLERPPRPDYQDIEGDWKLLPTELKINGTIQPVPEQVTLSLIRRDKDVPYEIIDAHAEVTNLMNFVMVGMLRAEETEEDRDFPKNPPFPLGIYTTGGVAMTKIGTTPEVRTLENELVTLFDQAVVYVRTIDNGHGPGYLSFDNEERGVSTKWERYEAQHLPVTENPFNLFN